MLRKNDTYPNEFAKWYSLITTHRNFSSDISELISSFRLNNSNLLDFGCGNGAHLSLLEKYKLSINLHGYDPSKGFSNIWNQKNLSKINFHNNLEDLDLKFDYVISWGEPLNFVNPKDLKSTIQSLKLLSKKNSTWMFEIWNPSYVNFQNIKPKTRSFNLSNPIGEVNAIKRICTPKLRVYEDTSKTNHIDFNYKLIGMPNEDFLSETTHHVFLHEIDKITQLLIPFKEISFSKRPNSKRYDYPNNIDSSILFLHLNF